MDETRSGTEPVPITLLNAQYARAVSDAGGLPMIIPAHKRIAASPDDLVGKLDGILFSGGSQRSETRFLERRSATLRDTDPERYDFEVALIKEAFGRGLPMMGICRGHQTLVEAFNGKVRSNSELQTDTDVAHHQSLPSVDAVHWIETVDGTLPARVLGPRTKVNSLHRQAVTDLPAMLKAAAYAPDGLIEAVVGEKPFVLGLQFHPEWLYEHRPEFLDLFRTFTTRAKEGSKPDSSNP
jgi:putative glutamine amidotransferase